MNNAKLRFIADNAAHFFANELHMACSVVSDEVLSCGRIGLSFVTVSIDIEDDLESTVVIGFGKELMEAVCREYTRGLPNISAKEIDILEDTAADVANIVVGNSMSIFQNDSKRAVHIGLPTMARNDIWVCGDDTLMRSTLSTDFGSMEIYLICKNDTGDD